MKAEVHHFLDASEEGYGMAYVHISGSLLIGKSRVNPIKYIPISRFELTAATLSIKMSKLME